MLTISAGHFGRATGASDLIDEGSEVVEVVTALQMHFQASTITPQFIIDRYSKNQAQNLRYLIAAHNKTKRVLDVSIHFNAISDIREAGIGTEVLYVNPKLKEFAANMSAVIAKAGEFKDRGAKYRTNLAWLNKTMKPAIIIEICFVNSKTDVHCYQKNKPQIIEAIFKLLESYCSIN
ncbi:N-acetylmuramoyl-L-alanine amidase [Solibacillus sp. MA9]|uniref:N-acetylmuramoyl-L-alanine amidase n=1 Tax=Solibacillus palustris TaxID=2908203 RepID=A0ABS9UB51_9BACL|nr:N-acetylmuramoyl-L-alanine amidase [Solibacillus sp. MA9]MCH7321554.1 N-acetylmuramoyl-L-alanine amidase [Solibacillus sp. MA9]